MELQTQHICEYFPPELAMAKKSDIAQCCNLNPLTGQSV